MGSNNKEISKNDKWVSEKRQVRTITTKEAGLRR